MDENILDMYEARMENDLSSYLDKKGRLSASCIAAFQHVTVQDAYVIKAYCEKVFDRLASDPEGLGESRDKPLTFPELAEHLKKEYREVERMREEAKVKDAKNGKEA